MEDIIDKLGISKSGIKTDSGEYKVQLRNSNELGRYYSIIENAVSSGYLDSVGENVNADSATLHYESDGYDIILSGSFVLDDEHYELTIKKKEDEE